MGVPSLGLGGGKIPALNMGNLQNTNEEMNSASNSSKREGIGRLNIGKAVQIQQDNLQKTELSL